MDLTIKYPHLKNQVPQPEGQAERTAAAVARIRARGRGRTTASIFDDIKPGQYIEVKHGGEVRLAFVLSTWPITREVYVELLNLVTGGKCYIAENDIVGFYVRRPAVKREKKSRVQSGGGQARNVLVAPGNW